MDFVNVASQPPRPPYIRFEKRPIETRDVAGNPTWKDFDFALITQPGSKDTTEKIAPEWLARIKVEAQRGNYPKEWAIEFNNAYELWKKDQAIPLNGTDVRNWPAASPSEIKIVTALGIMTVEDLANINEEVMQRIGMGARHLKQRAADYIQARQTHAPLVAEVETLRRNNQNLQERLEQLEATMTQMRLAQAQPVVGSGGAPVMGMFSPKLPDLETRLEEARAAAAEDKSDNKAVNEVLDDILG